jgi:hypothetical protein
MGLIHLSAGGGKFLAFFRRYFPFLAEKYGLRPVRTGHHVRTFGQFFSACTPDDHETEELTTHRPTAAAQTTTAAAARRRRHRPWLLPPWRLQRCAGARCACRLHLLLSRCIAVPVPVAAAAGHGSCCTTARRGPRRGSSPSSLASWDSTRPGLEPGPSRERKSI